MKKNYKRRKKEKEERILMKKKKQEEIYIQKKMEKEDNERKISNCLKTQTNVVNHTHASQTVKHNKVDNVQGKQNGIKKFIKRIKHRINIEINQKEKENAEKDKEIELRKRIEKMKMQVIQPASQTCLRQDQGQQKIESGTVPEKDNIITIDSSDDEK